MPSRRSFLSSTVGSKLLVAVTGISLVGFLIGHLAGNLLVFLGPETFNAYSHKLVSNPLVYPAEAGLVLLFLLHAWKTIQLTLGSSKARPVAYAKKHRAGHTSRKSPASTTMIWSGLFLLVFVPIHIRTFKFGAYYDTHEAGVRNLYQLVIEIFSKPGYVAFYVVGMTIIGFHLWHGVSSAFQTMGADTPRFTPVIRRIGWTLAVVIAVGFMAIPVWVFFAGGRS
jgi:succinate dehydrogenase / fumarate reductase, cytochrome b subunit